MSISKNTGGKRKQLASSPTSLPSLFHFFRRYKKKVIQGLIFHENNAGFKGHWELAEGTAPLSCILFLLTPQKYAFISTASLNRSERRKSQRRHLQLLLLHPGDPNTTISPQMAHFVSWEHRLWMSIHVPLCLAGFGVCLFFFFKPSPRVAVASQGHGLPHGGLAHFCKSQHRK